MGVFLIPIRASQCDKTIKVCCKSIEVKNTSDCCSKSTPNTEKKEKDCDGKCNHSSCQCLSFQTSVILPVSFKIKGEQIILKSGKENFYPSETNTSKGFYSTWLLPKIS